MIMAERPTFTARYGGSTYPVSSLTKERLIVGGMAPGENPFAPNRIGDTLQLVLAAERNGKAEKMTVTAIIVDLWNGEATFALPNGLSTPVPDTGDDEQSEPASYYMPNDTFTLPYAVPESTGARTTSPYAQQQQQQQQQSVAAASASHPVQAPTRPSPLRPQPAPAYAAPVYAAPAFAPAYAAPDAYAAPETQYQASDDPYGYSDGDTDSSYSVRDEQGDDLSESGYKGAAVLPTQEEIDRDLAADVARSRQQPAHADSDPYSGAYDGAPSTTTALAPYGNSGYAPYETVPSRSGSSPSGLAAVAVSPEGETTPALSDDDREEDKKGYIGRIAFYLLLAFLLLMIIFLMLYQRSNVQSVQASLRGQTIEVTAPVKGRITEVLVAEGSIVAVGDPLFALDDESARVELEALQSAVESEALLVDQTRDALREAQALVSGSPSDDFVEPTVVRQGVDPAAIQASRARLEAATIQAAQAAEEAVRAERLLAGGAMTRGAYEEVQSEAREAEAMRQARAADLTAVRGGGRTYTSGGNSRGNQRLSNQLRLIDLQRDLTKQEARLREAQLSFERAAEGVQQARVVAQSGGVVATLVRNAGSYVEGGSAVMTIETDARPFVLAYFPFRESRLIQTNAAATVRFPAAGESVAGHVVAIGQLALGETGTGKILTDQQALIPVRILLDELPQGVSSGMQADSEVEVGLGTILSGRLR